MKQLLYQTRKKCCLSITFQQNCQYFRPLRVFIMTLCESEQHSSVDTSAILVVTPAACWDEPHVIPCLEDASHTNHTARDRGQHAHPSNPL